MSHRGQRSGNIHKPNAVGVTHETKFDVVNNPQFQLGVGGSKASSFETAPHIAVYPSMTIAIQLSTIATQMSTTATRLSTSATRLRMSATQMLRAATPWGTSPFSPLSTIIRLLHAAIYISKTNFYSIIYSILINIMIASETLISSRSPALRAADGR
jgi:hypothetical protein